MATEIDAIKSHEAHIGATDTEDAKKVLARIAEGNEYCARAGLGRRTVGSPLGQPQ